ncbi:MAG: ATP/GTP-binding protein [Candidatus Bathyarchaeota archaeon]|nr:MAG: ATP/GTP-binding protein [Candidatus Bathyarchaeota archaeon]
MFLIFIVGTAGSGKSLLTSTFSEWLRMSKQDVTILNLDPGVMTLPYTPDLDVRDYVSISDLMEKHQLGPNGALIMATDLIAGHVETLSNKLQDIDSDVVLVDTPGQIELFAFRACGPYITMELTKEPKAIVYLFDSVFSLNPANYISNLFLSAAVFNRLVIPQAHVLSKCDLLPPEKIDAIVEWSKNPETLEMIIEQELKGTKRLLSRDMMYAIYSLDLHFLLIPVSAKSNKGLIDLNMVLERIFTGGEKFTY